MKTDQREYNIFVLEEYYCNRMTELVENEQFDDSHAIFEEFVVDEEPSEWIFLNDLTNVC